MPATKKEKAKRKSQALSATARAASIKAFKEAARERGYKSLSVAGLLLHFGYQKRSEVNLKLITDSLMKSGLTVYPRLDIAFKLTESLRIYCFPIRTTRGLKILMPMRSGEYDTSVSRRLNSTFRSII